MSQEAIKTDGLKVMKDKLVVKSNRIIEARYKLTLGEQRILYLLAAAIDQEDTVFRPYRVSIKDLAELFDISYSGKLIDEVFATLKRLRNREFTPYIEDLKASRGSKSNATIGWIEYAEYIDGDASVEIKLHDKLMPYYLNLKDRFTKIPFLAVTYFKSAYSIRFYEMMKAETFKADKNGAFQKSFNYQALREKFEIQEGEYKYFKDFRIRVIEPAVRDISEFSDILIKNVEYKKTGKKFTGIVFHCEKSKQGSLFKEESPLQNNPIRLKEDAPDLIKNLFTYGISETAAQALIGKHGEERIRRNIEYFLSFRKTGATMKNPTGYLVNAIEKDYAIAQMTIENTEKAKVFKAREEQEISEREEKAREQRKKAQISTIITAFDVLSESEQATILAEYKVQLSDIMRNAFEKFGHRHASQRYAFAKFCGTPLQEKTGQVFELNMNS